jgi:cell division transport system permease protein
MTRIMFFIAEAFRAMRRQAAPSMAAIVTIVVTTLLLGVLIPVLKASEDTAGDVREQIGITVFMHPEVKESEARPLVGKIKAVDHVTQAELITKEEGLKILENRLRGDRDDILGELPAGNNPLPVSIDVSLDDPDNLEAVTSELQPVGSSGQAKPFSPLIDDVNDARAQSNQIRQVTGAVKIVLIVIAVLLLIASLLLVANTIRLSIYARRREVEVMRLVGATNWFIRWPFVIEGVLVGLSGALLAVAILSLGKVIIVDPLADDFALIDNFSSVAFLPLAIALIGSAIVVSALGSGVTLRRFLRI